MFQTLKSAILTIALFLFPLFFLPITQEYFTTNKFYLISAASLVLLLISAAEILFSKTRYRIVPGKIDLLKFFLLAAVLLSIIISSPNKIQALLSPNFGFVALLSLTILTFYIDRSSIVVSKILSLSTLILSATTIVFFFHPFRNNQLPFELQFLKNRFFTPLGTQTDLAIFLGFMIVVEILQLVLLSKSTKKSSLTTGYYLLTTILTLSAFGLTVYSLLSGGADRVMPFAYSWYSFAETLKNPLTAIFGVGIDNLAAVFTRVKDIPYNLSGLWEIRSFDLGRTSLLHIATESGLLGLTSTVTILIWAFKKVLKNNTKLLLVPLLYLILILLFFPPSLLVFFIFFIGLTSINTDEQVNSSLNSSNLPLKLLYFPLAIVLTILTIASLFFLSRSYLAEFFFKQSIDALANKKGKALYENQRKAVQVNPFIERFHINFSQTNLLLASSLGQKLNPSKQELKNIKDAQQTAIIEANNAVILNPQKASNWENLGLISRNLTDVFEDTQKQTIEAYEKAVLLDPQNPIYRLNLGSVYYSQADFSQAIRLFEQTVALKKDLPNAHYNLSWALFQKQEYQKAIQEMLTSVSLLDPEKEKTDREKAQKDLEMMRNKLKPGQTPAESEYFQEPAGELMLTTPPVSTNAPQLDFSRIATPEVEIK